MTVVVDALSMKRSMIGAFPTSSLVGRNNYASMSLSPTSPRCPLLRSSTVSLLLTDTATDTDTEQPRPRMASIPPDAQQSTLPPPTGLPFDARQPDSDTIRLYPLSNYTFGTKEAQPEEDPSVKDRLRRLEEHYAQHGMRRTCEAVLVCHEHNHPHVLMLQIANAFFKL